MRWAKYLFLSIFLAGCPFQVDESVESDCFENTDCVQGEICVSGTCMETTDSTTEPDPDPLTTPTTDAEWPQTQDDYSPSHLSIITSLKYSEDEEGNLYGTIIRMGSQMSSDALPNDILREQIEAGNIVDLIDYRGLRDGSEDHGFLMGHLKGSWVEGMTWDEISQGSGAVFVDPRSFEPQTGRPYQTYESAYVLDGSFRGNNGSADLSHLDVSHPGRLVYAIPIRGAVFAATDFSLNADGIGQLSGEISGYVPLANFAEGFNAGYRESCACAGFGENDDLYWYDSSTNAWTCTPEDYDTAPCDEVAPHCFAWISSCALYAQGMVGDLDKDPDYPGNDAWSVRVEITTRPVEFAGIE